MTNVSTTEINTSQSTSAVPVTPTEILNSKVATLVERYRFFAKASAENIIQLAKTLADAHGELSSTERDEFCNAIGVKEKSSTYRKLLKIGLSADRFEHHLDKMPTAWTTVYNLTKLTPGDFETVAKNEAFSPTMTARTISAIVGSAKKESLKQDNAPKVSSSDTPKAPLADAPKAPSLEATKAQLPDAVTYPVVAAAVVREPLTSPKTILINLDGLDDSDVEDVYTHILIMRADKQFTFEMSNGMRAFERSLKSKNLFQTEQAA